MPTAYVFGAGASLEVGYPLASKMGGGLLAFMRAHETPMTRVHGQFLSEVFGESPNVEDLISEIQYQINALSGAESIADKIIRSNLGNAQGVLAHALREWFSQIRLNAAPSYASFSARIIQPRDTVITLNYDDSLERELKRVNKWGVSQGYGFPLSSIEQPSDVRVLKLHGSINWLVSLFGGATSGTFAVVNGSMVPHPLIPRDDLDFLGYEKFAGHVFNGGAAFPCLILPGSSKEFFYDSSLGREYTEFWDALWVQAKTSLKGCDRLVICGYSLLPVDQRARDLLLGAPQKGIPVEVISGSQTERIADDFRAAGFNKVHAFPGGYFADWVMSQTS